MINNWSKIPNDTKAVILRSRTGNLNEGVNKHSKNGCKTVKAPYFSLRKFTKDNLHGLLAKIISIFLSEHNEVDVTKDEADPDSTLLVKATSANATNPGDIRKLMSTPGNSKVISNKKSSF